MKLGPTAIQVLAVSDPGAAQSDRIKVKSAAPKKRKRRGKPEPVAVTPDLLRSNDLLNHLDEELLLALCPRVQHVDVEREDLLLDGQPVLDDSARVLFILHGDVNVMRAEHDGRFDVANYLSVGDVFIEKLFVHEDIKHIKVQAMCPVRALQMTYRDVNVLLGENKAFRDAFSERIRELAHRQKTRFDNRFQKEIAQFLVQQRLTFAGRIKLKRMDICIECDGCYDACIDRHGTDRLGGSEVKYGLTEVPQNCHNCVVPECMDKCKFGHITRDAQTREIIIDDNCIGCTMCSKGCSFGSIRMHPISELNLEKYFPNRKPDAKGKNIAQKCDNCTGYADKACITACPTGALFQIDGAELFNSWEQFNVHRRPGYDQVESPEAVARPWRRFWVAFAVLNAVFLFWECFGRMYWPNLTFAHGLYVMGVADSDIDPMAPFKAGDFFSHALGYIGGFLMIGTQVYRLRGWLASSSVLMEAHIWMGVIGGMYGLFHTTFVFTDTVAIVTFGTMVLAILTGTAGRYLLYMVPRSQAGTQLAIAELDGQIQELNRRIEGAFEDAQKGYTAIIRLASLSEESDRRVDAMTREDSSGLASWKTFFVNIIRIFVEVRRSRQSIDDLAHEMESGLKEGKVDAMKALLNEKARLERSIRQHDFLAGVLKRYRVIHVTSSNIMFGALALHIVFALMYQVGN